MNEIRNISWKEFNNIISKESDYQIIDLRIIKGTPLDYKNLILIPFDKLTENINKISKEKKVIFLCDNGANSFFAVKILQDLHNFTNLYNLKGGLNSNDKL